MLHKSNLTFNNQEDSAYSTIFLFFFVQITQSCSSISLLDRFFGILFHQAHVYMIIFKRNAWRRLMVTGRNKASRPHRGKQPFKFRAHRRFSLRHRHLVKAADEKKVRIQLAQAVDIDTRLSFQWKNTVDSGANEPRNHHGNVSVGVDNDLGAVFFDFRNDALIICCLLYTSDAADE